MYAFIHSSSTTALSASLSWYSRAALKGAAIARAIIRMASSQIRMRSARVSPSSPLTSRGKMLTMARDTAPTRPEAIFEESMPSTPRWRMEHPQQILDASASKGMGRRQIAATAKVCRKLPVQWASRIESAATGRIADCTKTLMVPETKTPMRHVVSSLLAERPSDVLGLREGKRTRSLRKCGRRGNATRTQTKYARLMKARTTEAGRSGDCKAPVTGCRTAGSSAPRPRPRSFARKIRDCTFACLSLVLREARTKRAWKRTPEPRPWTSLASRATDGPKPKSCARTMRTWPRRRKTPESTKPAMWFARWVTVRVNHNDRGMGK
mmetsp:Transcript_92458/g.293226  ORF Transcript_92458/g.293226 Transcript_92458/m.293226 type:complete len:324 (-) Transcript_92458:18-989(-)